MFSLFEVRTGRWRLPLAVVTAVLVAEGAVLLLRPRDGVIEPAPVNARSYFSEHELARARDFRRPQLALAGGQLAIELAVLVLLVLRPPTRLRTPFRRPLVAGALAGGALSVMVAVAPLPLGAVARARAVDAGLITQSWGGWAGDVAKSTVIGAVMTSAGAALLLGLMRRFPRHWWAPVSVAVIVLSAVFLWLAPIVIDPIFNKFTPLPDGPLRSQVLDLAERSGVDVGQVYRIDASRRTTGANAYVVGLGHTKRVVLYDNLVEGFSPAEVRSVVAHELGHVKENDVPMGLLWVALVTPAGVLLIQRLTERLAPGGGYAPVGREPLAMPTGLPAAALSLALVSFGLGIAGNHLSRRVEARADAHALRITHDPAGFIALEHRLATGNLSDPDPPSGLVALFGTHPPTVERIGFALTYARGQ